MDEVLNDCSLPISPSDYKIKVCIINYITTNRLSKFYIPRT